VLALCASRVGLGDTRVSPQFRQPLVAHGALLEVRGRQAKLGAAPDGDNARKEVGRKQLLADDANIFVACRGPDDDPILLDALSDELARERPGLVLRRLVLVRPVEKGAVEVDDDEERAWFLNGDGLLRRTLQVGGGRVGHAT